MKLKRLITFLSLGALFVLTFSACGGGGSPTPSSNTSTSSPATGGDTPTPPVTQEPVPIKPDVFAAMSTSVKLSAIATDPTTGDIIVAGWGFGSTATRYMRFNTTGKKLFTVMATPTADVETTPGNIAVTQTGSVYSILRKKIGSGMGTPSSSELVAITPGGITPLGLLADNAFSALITTDKTDVYVERTGIPSNVLQYSVSGYYMTMFEGSKLASSTEGYYAENILKETVSRYTKDGGVHWTVQLQPLSSTSLVLEDPSGATVIFSSRIVSSNTTYTVTSYDTATGDFLSEGSTTLPSNYTGAKYGVSSKGILYVTYQTMDGQATIAKINARSGTLITSAPLPWKGTTFAISGDVLYFLNGSEIRTLNATTLK